MQKRGYSVIKRIVLVAAIIAICGLQVLAADAPIAVTGTANDAVLPVTTAAAVTNTAAAAVTLTAQVHGKVMELGSPDPVDYAQVQVEGTTLTAIGDSKGRYKMNIQAGYSVLVFTADGYAPRKKKISVRPGHDLE